MSDSQESVLVLLMKAYIWFDSALQQSAEHFGVPRLSRQQSMLMTNLIRTGGRPSDLARQLGISRQAIHYTIRELCELGILELVPDPNDRRSKIAQYSAQGEKIAQPVRRIVEELELELGERIGPRLERNLHEALAKDWGEPPLVLPQDLEPAAAVG